MDKIFIRNLKVHAILGVNPAERTQAQDILISVTLDTDTRQAAASDAIEHCVNYADLAQRITERVKTARRFTVESLAADIAQLCLEDAKVSSVWVRVDKPQALAEAEGLGVEIERRAAS